MKFDGWPDILCRYVVDCWKRRTFIDAVVTNGRVQYPVHRIVLASSLPGMRSFLHDSEDDLMVVVFSGWADDELRDMIATMYAPPTADGDDVKREPGLDDSYPFLEKDIPTVPFSITPIGDKVDRVSPEPERTWSISVVQGSDSDINLDALRELAKKYAPPPTTPKPTRKSTPPPRKYRPSPPEFNIEKLMTMSMETKKKRPYRFKKRPKAKDPSEKPKYEWTTSPICPICKEDCNTAVDMLKHKADAHLIPDPSPESLACPQCDMSFKESYQKRIHMARHEKKSWLCHICKAGFRQGSALRDHLTVHSGKHEYCCQYCSKTFARKENLKIHENTHNNIYRYTCSYCPKQFQGTTALNRHENSHTGNRPFICDLCGKAFKSSGNLRTHKLIHLGPGVGPYSCDHCKMRFKYNQVRKRHQIKCKAQYDYYPA